MPYIGYWQLVNTVDRFVIYDDVNYIKQGWVNRNRILINKVPTYITVPLDHASPNKKICNLLLSSSNMWRDKLLKTIENTYRRAPYYFEAFPVVESVIRYEERQLSEYLIYGIRTLASYLFINTEFVWSSRVYGNDDLHGQNRVLDICDRENASIYINPQGGRELYDFEEFQAAGINLQFLEMRPVPYKQRTEGFVPYLSIIDAMMELGSKKLQNYLQEFDLVSV